LSLTSRHKANCSSALANSSIRIAVSFSFIYTNAIGNYYHLMYDANYSH